MLTGDFNVDERFFSTNSALHHGHNQQHQHQQQIHHHHHHQHPHHHLHNHPHPLAERGQRILHVKDNVKLESSSSSQTSANATTASAAAFFSAASLAAGAPNANSYLCQDCFRTFKDVNNFKEHRFQEHAIREYPNVKKCKLCSYATLLKSKYDCHMRCHLNNKIIRCNRCDYSTINIRHMSRHERMHMISLSKETNDKSGATLQQQIITKAATARAATTQGNTPHLSPHYKYMKKLKIEKFSSTGLTMSMPRPSNIPAPVASQPSLGN